MLKDFSLGAVSVGAILMIIVGLIKNAMAPETVQVFATLEAIGDFSS